MRNLDAVHDVEREKYERLWATPEYRDSCACVVEAGRFLQIAPPRRGATVIDFGCGTGRGGLRLAMDGMDVTLVDFAANCLDDRVAGLCLNDDDNSALLVPPKSKPGNLRFLRRDLTDQWAPNEKQAEFGFCVDVMEHIPPTQVDTVLHNILNAAGRVWLTISVVPDKYGPLLVGEPLHLSIYPRDWWRDRLRGWDCDFYYSDTDARHCRFLVGRDET